MAGVQKATKGGPKNLQLNQGMKAAPSLLKKVKSKTHYDHVVESLSKKLYVLYVYGTPKNEPEASSMKSIETYLEETAKKLPDVPIWKVDCSLVSLEMLYTICWSEDPMPHLRVLKDGDLKGVYKTVIDLENRLSHFRQLAASQ